MADLNRRYEKCEQDLKQFRSEVAEHQGSVASGATQARFCPNTRHSTRDLKHGGSATFRLSMPRKWPLESLACVSPH